MPISPSRPRIRSRSYLPTARRCVSARTALAPAAALLVGLGGAGPLPAAQEEAPSPGAPPAERLAGVERLLTRLGRERGEELWPGFRPDTFPHFIVFQRTGKLALNWRGDPLPGFRAVPGSRRAEWSEAESVSIPSGRGVAFSSVPPDAPLGSIVGLAAHEAFHVLQRAMAAEGWEGGGGENAWLVRTYPELDAANEAGWALEGKRLAAAMAAEGPEAARRAAREFLAAREARQAALAPELAEYEVRAELNEGLAQYVQMRALRLLAKELRGPWSASTRAEAEAEVARLDDLLGLGDRSLRRRFYVTGSAIGLLLDRLAGPAWKAELVRRELSLQEALAEAVGYRSGETPAPPDAEADSLRAEAGRRVAARLARRQAIADGALAAPGLLLVLDASALGGLPGCGFDPQNLLQTGGALLHTRWVRFCRDEGFEAEFNAPTLEEAGWLARAVAGDPEGVRVRSEGRTVALPAEGAAETLRQVEIEAPGVTLRAARAAVARSGRVLAVRPLPPPE